MPANPVFGFHEKAFAFVRKIAYPMKALERVPNEFLDQARLVSQVILCKGPVPVA
jgi:hypothetical protein